MRSRVSSTTSFGVTLPLTSCSAIEITPVSVEAACLTRAAAARALSVRLICALVPARRAVAVGAVRAVRAVAGLAAFGAGLAAADLLLAVEPVAALVVLLVLA